MVYSRPDPFRFIPPPPALNTLAPFLDEARDVLETPGLDEDQSQLLASYCLRYALRLGAKKYKNLNDDERRYLNQLKEHCDSLGVVPISSHHAGEEPPNIPEENQQGENQDGTNLNEEAQKHQELICSFAIKAIKQAEKLEESRANQVEIGRMFHTALVFLQVLKVFGGLTTKYQENLNYCYWKTRMCSHLLENRVLEHDQDSIQDKYEIKENEILGRGTYGIVCTAIHRNTGARYACKILHINRTSPRYVSKLHEEIAIMRELDHPHIVSLHEVFYDKRRIYLVMDLCTGGELYQYVAKQEGEHLSEYDAIRLTLQMLSAIAFMHQCKIVHRDLKLENWLLEDKHEGAHLRLVDFGLSKHFTHDQFMTHQVGSIFYVAPEVLQGEYTEKCDIWSTGVIVYMLLSGIPPFWGRNQSEIQYQIFKKELTFPESHFAGVSDLAKDFIRHLLVRDEQRRLSAEEALLHPWLAVNKPLSIEIPLARKSEVIFSLQQFSQTNNFVRVISEIAAFNLRSEQIIQMRELFKKIDSNNSGTISIDELKTALFDGTEFDLKEIQNLFDAINVTHSQEIRYHEFIAATMWNKIHFDEERFREIFDSIDSEHRGYLTKESLQHIVGMDFNEEDIERMIKDADLNGDGRIDFEEFVRLWKENAFSKQLNDTEEESIELK